MKIMLSRLLDDKGISQNQMAKDTGISVTTLRNLNHNRTTRISLDILEKIWTVMWKIFFSWKSEDCLNLPDVVECL